MKLSLAFLLSFAAAGGVSAVESSVRGSVSRTLKKGDSEDSEDMVVSAAEEFLFDAGSCATEVQRQTGCDIVETAIAAESFSTLVDLVATAGLAETLQSPGPFTVFAPLDSAFPTGDALEEFRESTDMDTLTSILTFHVVPGTIMASDLTEGGTVTTVQGTNLTFSLANGPMVNNANIVAADIMATNGVIHVIDAVLDPTAPTMDIVETAIAAGNFTTLVDLVATAGLVETLQSPGPFTVFAPLDSAFPSGVALEEFKNSTDLETLTSVLTYHVVPGKVMSSALAEGLSVATVQGSNITFSLMNGAMVNDANIVAADIETTNGVIHIIDTVLMPGTSEEADMTTPDAPISAEMDIVDTAITAGSFTILADLLVQTGLVAALKEEGPFTVFAPTDAAFGTEEQVAAIRALPAPTIAQILTYHVVPGQVMAADLSDGQEVNTLFGETFTVEIEGDGSVTVDDANVVETDIMASNGVIHVIDQVIIPDAVVLP